MRTIFLALAVAAAPAMALTDDSPPDSHSAGDSGCGVNTFILQDGTTTRISGSTDDLNHFEARMRAISAPALFTRIDGKDYVISDPAVVDSAREIFSRSVPVKAEKRALKQESRDLMRRQHHLEARRGDEAEAAELAAEERSLEERREKHDAKRERVSREMKADLTDLAREAIRAGKALGAMPTIDIEYGPPEGSK